MLSFLDLLALILNVCTFMVQTFRTNLVLMHFLLKLKLLKPISYLTLDSLFAKYNKDSDYFIVKGQLSSGRRRNIDYNRYPEAGVIGAPGSTSFPITYRGLDYLLDGRQKVLYHYATKGRIVLAYKTLLYRKHHIMMPTLSMNDHDSDLDEIIFNPEKFDVCGREECTVLPLLDYKENRLWALNLTILSLLSDPLGLISLKLALAVIGFSFEWFRPVSSVVYEKSFGYVAWKCCASFTFRNRKILDFLSNFSDRFRVCDREIGLINVLQKDSLVCSAIGCMEHLEAVDVEALIDQEYFEFKASIERILGDHQRLEEGILVKDQDLADVVVKPRMSDNKGISFYMARGTWHCNLLLLRGSQENENWIKCAYILAKGKAYKMRVAFGSRTGHLIDSTAMVSPTFHRLKVDYALLTSNTDTRVAIQNLAGWSNPWSRSLAQDLLSTLASAG